MNDKNCRNYYVNEASIVNYESYPHSHILPRVYNYKLSTNVISYSLLFTSNL